MGPGHTSKVCLLLSPHLLSPMIPCVVVQYYDVPGLSLRTALYRLAVFNKEDGFRQGVGLKFFVI